MEIHLISPNVKGVSASGGICLSVAWLKLYSSLAIQKLNIVMLPPLQKHFVVGSQKETSNFRLISVEHKQNKYLTHLLLRLAAVFEYFQLNSLGVSFLAFLACNRCFDKRCTGSTIFLLQGIV
jgi:hypothetical protein